VAYSGSDSDRNFEARRHKNVATASTVAPYTGGICGRIA
jgi:hypothetical protein